MESPFKEKKSRQVRMQFWTLLVVVSQNLSFFFWFITLKHEHDITNQIKRLKDYVKKHEAYFHVIYL